MKIQHEWAEARIKVDSSYTRKIFSAENLCGPTRLLSRAVWKVVALQITPALEK